MSEQNQHEPPPVAPGVFAKPAGDEDPVLLGGCCPKCDRKFFPRPPRCPHCLGKIHEQPLGGTGRLYTYTVVRVKPPWGLPRPYGLGYIDLDESGLRVLGLLDSETLDNLFIGLPMKLAVGELGHNFRGESCLRPYFKPMKGHSTPGGRHE